MSARELHTRVQNLSRYANESLYKTRRYLLKQDAHAECHQYCTQCREIHSIEPFEIGIAILQSISEWQYDKVDWTGKNIYMYFISHRVQHNNTVITIKHTQKDTNNNDKTQIRRENKTQSKT